MKNWKRIFLICLFLVGGTALFAYYSFNQFNNALDSLSALSISSVSSVSTPSEKKKGSISTPTPTLISPQLQTPEDLELLFTFPQKGDEIYIGCTYEILWQSSTTVDSIETSLVDAGTHKPAEPTVNEISKEHIINPDSQNLKWKVGTVWPGEYYIAVSKINDADINMKSKVFTINRMPRGIDAEEKQNICEKTDGLF